MDQAHYVVQQNLKKLCSDVDLYAAYKAGRVSGALSAVVRGQKDVEVPTYTDRSEEVSGGLYDRALADTVSAIETAFTDLEGLLSRDLSWIPEGKSITVKSAKVTDFSVGYTQPTEFTVSAQMTIARFEISLTKSEAVAHPALPSSYVPMMHIALTIKDKAGSKK